MERRFFVVPVEKFQGNNPYFRAPSEVGCFSLDIDCKFLDDKSRLRYYTPPKVVNCDLGVGFKDFIRKNEDENSRLDNLLRWIIHHPEKFKVNVGNKRDDGSLHTDFVTWRGHMTKFLCTPYERKEPWQMAASLFNGTIYMSEVETDEARQRKMSLTERQDEMCYWGYKFEDYTTSLVNQTSNVKAENAAINNKEQYVTVVRSRLEKHSLVYGAEVDCCIKGNKTAISPPLNYIELKTSRIIENDRMGWSFERYKLLKWWSQSFLAGVPKIVCGFRDDNGIVKELRDYNTLEIPNKVSGERNMWKGSISLNFCNQFLVWVKSVVKDEDAVYMLHWREPFSHVYVQISKDPKDTFLPDWYLKHKKT